MSSADVIARWVRDFPDWPVPGVTFRDIGPLLARADAFGEVTGDLAERISAHAVDAVVGIEARGFIVGVAVAERLGVGFVPVRKAGKLPGELLVATYDLEYGSATIEMQAGVLEPAARVAVVDDVLATGGTLAASIDLVRRAGADPAIAAVMIELPDLRGRERLAPLDCISLTTY